MKKRLRREAGLWDSIKETGKKMKETVVGISDNDKQKFIDKLKKIDKELDNLKIVFNNSKRDIERLPEYIQDHTNVMADDMNSKVKEEVTNMIGRKNVEYYSKRWLGFIFNNSDNRMAAYYFDNKFGIDIDQYIDKLSKKVKNKNLLSIIQDMDHKYIESFYKLADNNYLKLAVNEMEKYFPSRIDYIKDCQDALCSSATRKDINENEKKDLSLAFNAHIKDLEKAKEHIPEIVSSLSSCIKQSKSIYKHIQALQAEYK